MVKYPKVSVIVPAYNAEGSISDCLISIIRQDYPSECLEVICVDDGSTDGTRDIAKDINGVTLISQANGGPAKARNTGWRASGGEIIVFTDSDCIAPADWITKLITILADEDVVGGGIEPESVGTLSESFEQTRRDRLYGKVKRHVRALPSCNLAFKRNILEKVEGFDEDYKKASAEDYDLCERVSVNGVKILYDPAITIVHRHVTTTSDLLKKARMHGMEIMLYRRKNGASIPIEMVKIIVKVVALPILIIMRYGLADMMMGARYELSGIIGQFIGLKKYMLVKDGNN